MQDGIPLGVVDDCWEKQNFFKFDVFWTPLKTGRSITSETDAPSLDRLFCMCGFYCGNVSVLLLLFGAMLGLWLGVFLVYSSISGINQISLRLIFYVASLCELCCKMSIQFGFIVPSLMNITVETSSSNTTWKWGYTWSVAGFRTIASAVWSRSPELTKIGLKGSI